MANKNMLSGADLSQYEQNENPPLALSPEFIAYLACLGGHDVTADGTWSPDTSPEDREVLLREFGEKQQRGFLK